MNRFFSVVAVLLCALMPIPSTAVDVEIYGRAHVSLDVLGDGDDYGLNASSNLSHLGFRGHHQINADYQVYFQIEQLIRYGQRGSDLASRDTFAGIRGNFGSVRIGYFEPPGTTLRARVDQFNSRVGDSRNIASGNDMAFDVRFRNGIHYTSPKYRGLTFDLQYTPHDDTGATSQNDQEGLSSRVTYETSRLFLGLAYQSYEDGEQTPQAWRFGSEYKLTDIWRMTGFVQHARQLEGGDRLVFGVGTAYQWGTYIGRAQLYQSSSNDNPDTGATMLVVGIDRRFTSQFTAYVSLGVTSNDEQANFSVSAGGRDTGLIPVLGESATGLSVGMIFNF